jgi:hypothetical protein
MRRREGALAVLKIAVLAYLGLALVGCATIVSGTTQQVSFDSEPEGVKVSVDGRELGLTPMTIQFDKSTKKQNVTFEKEGYKTRTMHMATTADPWFFGNILLGGLIGSTTDGLSGAVVQYAPDQYFVSLTPGEGIEEDPDVRAFIVSGYTNIVEELQSEPGEYVESLMHLLNLPESRWEDETERIRKMSEIYSSIPTFADEVVKHYLE